MVHLFRVIAIVFTSVLACGAGEASTRDQQSALLKNLETHFVKRDLGSIQNPDGNLISIQIEHSLIEPPNGKERARFRSFDQIEQWLRSRERYHDNSINEHHPFREVRTGQFTAPNRFDYDNMGISHNTWYLSQVYFTKIKGRVAIKKIIIYDGD